MSEQDLPDAVGSAPQRTPPDERPLIESPASRADRGPDGRFLKGVSHGAITGVKSKYIPKALLPEQAEVRVLLREQREAIVADLGGCENVSALRLSLVDRFLTLQALAAWQEGELLKHGLFTARGRTRAVFTALLSTVDRLTRLAIAIGLERKAKDLNDSLADLMAKYGHG
jgi:hypothetical protein